MKSLYRILFLFLFVSSFFSSAVFAYSTSCDGDDVSRINDATADAYKEYTIDDPEYPFENQTDKAYYFKFKTKADGEITISFDSTSGYIQKMKIGTSCGGKEIYKIKGNQGLKKFNVTKGTTYYILMQEKNNDNRLKFKLRFNFKVSSVCHGCDCSLDSAANDNSPGALIDRLNGATSDISRCISGDSESDDKDYYYFTVQADGVLKVKTSSPNSHDYYLRLGSTEHGDEYYKKTAAQSHKVNDITLSKGDTVYVYLKETGSDKDEYEVHFDFATNTSTVEDADDICYEPVELDGTMCVNAGPCGGGIDCKKSYPLRNISGSTLSDVEVDYDESGMSGTYGSSCGVDDTNGKAGECKSENNVDMGPAGILGSTTHYKLDNDIDSGNNENKVWAKNLVRGGCFEGSSLYATYVKNGRKHRGRVKACPPSYCETHNLSQGFHVIDPDGGDDENSYEIYCDMNSTLAPRELIALPLKNDYNNFVFKDDNPQENYYQAAEDAKADDIKNEFNFLQIRIDDNTHKITVVPSSVAEGSANEGYFSNINLIGTPFSIDWSDTTLQNCDTSKLRKGAWDQAVKINTLDYTKGRCQVDRMSLKLIDNYKYLTYSDIEGTDGQYDHEILEETCRQIFEKVPDDAAHLPTQNGVSDGYFWVDPDKGGRGSGDAIDTKFRPFVAYCKYQEDINQAWTFVMALDAKVTKSKDDIHTMKEVRANPNMYYDTCSQLGLLFFVPNTKDTFQRTRTYLKDNKGEWIDYTGTIREKYKMFTGDPNKEYYMQGEGFNEIWPYGPFGLYFPQEGKHDVNGNSWAWYPNDISKQGNMSGRCMNSGQGSGADPCTDYKLSPLANDDGTMGMAGWRTTLQDMVQNGLSGITNGEEFWIADVGAGEYIHESIKNNGTPECSITSPGSNRNTSGACDYIYYEPNGNYTKNAWLNFVSDSEGNVYHNDDNGDFYSYYDYMCMAWDNYYGFSRYGLTDGPFKVIKHDPSVNQNTTFDPANDFNITTTVVNSDTDFDALLLTQQLDKIDKDQNISAGVFLVAYDEVYENSLLTNKVKDLHYYGQIGPNEDFSAHQAGIISLNANAHYPLVKMPKAHRKAGFQFKYCGYNGSDWRSCWSVVDNGGSTTATCTNGYDSSTGKPKSPCQVADSNPFALRPDRFKIASVDGIYSNYMLVVKAADVNISYVAADGIDQATVDYNVSFAQLDTDISLIQSGLSCSTSFLDDTNQSAYSFKDGKDTYQYTLSDVGNYKFTLREIEGLEYARVDANDTAWADRQITENNITLVIKPDHFEISAIPNPNHNVDGNFTYLSNDVDNMGAKLDFNVSAKNSAGGTTLNYTNSCYASDINFDANYTIALSDESSANTLAQVNTINYLVKDKNDANITIAHNASPRSDKAFIKHGDKISKIVFTNDVNGSARIIVKFNFNRQPNQAVNPFVLNLNNINVADTNTSMTVNTQNAAVDVNATFVYGRASGPKRAGYTNCVDHQSNCVSGDDSPRVVFQIYSDANGDKNIDALSKQNKNGIKADHDGTQDSRWWTSVFHDMKNNTFVSGNDGKINQTGTITEDATPSHISQEGLDKEQNYKYKARLKYQGQDGYIKEGHLKHYPSSWLIYDPNSAAATYNKFNFNFVTEGWSGKHESSATGKTKAAHKTSKRIMW